MKSDKVSLGVFTSQNSIAVLEILNLAVCAGYNLVNENKKLAEFSSPCGQSMYIVKTSATINNIKVMVHPELKLDDLRQFDGVNSDLISNCHRFHSNMTKFPRRINNGLNPTTYGWQLTFNTLGCFKRFLEAFKS